MTRAHAKAATSPSPGTERGICLNIHENPPATSDPSPDTRAGQTQAILQQTTQCRRRGWMYRAINAVILFSKLESGEYIISCIILGKGFLVERIQACKVEESGVNSREMRTLTSKQVTCNRDPS